MRFSRLWIDLTALFLLYFIIQADAFDEINDLNAPAQNNWIGGWFPGPPLVKTAPSHPHRDMFKWINDTCDNGKLNLTMDWDFSPINYTCYDKNKIIPDSLIQSVLISKRLPEKYQAGHVCMAEKISYETDIPVYGNHRPAWAKWGEYLFLPKQRWLHNLEHGAVIMLYHPCTHPVYVSEVRRIVTDCLYRHIITRDTSLSVNHPIALVTWRHKLLISYPSEKMIKQFIKTYGKKGPEETARQGYYDELLITPSKIVTDLGDSVLCPHKE